MSVVPHQTTIVPEPEPGILGMLERLATNPDVPVDKLERLLAMQERIMAKRGEDDFNAAMSAAQSEMGRVSADANNPQTKSKYASYGKLDRSLRPIYTKHGFALSFGTAPSQSPDMLIVTCRVTHRGGFCRDYSIPMPADGKGAKGGDVMTKTHATGAAASYGMRYLLKMIFNVAIGEDDNNGNAPQRNAAKITESQAADLDALIEEVKANKPAFLKFYKIEKVADLAAADLANAVANLNGKRK